VPVWVGGLAVFLPVWVCGLAVVVASSFKTQKTQANAGPTHDTQPVFCWSAHSGDPHYGHPTCYNFETVTMAPFEFSPPQSPAE
jgi:hypothetical protein